MILKNKTKRSFGFGSQTLPPEASDEFPDSFSTHPVVKALVARGELEIIDETIKDDDVPPADPPAGPKPKPTDAAEIEALLKKIPTAKRDALVKICDEYGVPFTEEHEAKDLKVILNAFLTGGDGNADPEGDQ